MSFKVICSECGQEQEFRNKDSYHGDNIEIDIAIEENGSINSVTFYCENEKCNNSIAM